MEIVCESAFPYLSEAELLLMSPLAISEHFSAGDYLFKSGQEKIDLFIVQRGQVDIVNPRHDNEDLVSHRVGQFTGDIDLLTRRPALVSAVAASDTRVLRVKNDHVREVLLKISHLSDKLLTASDIAPGATELDAVQLTLDCGAVISAQVVLIVSGVVWRKLEAKNAQRSERAGVYYACTTVEAILHDRSDVAVVGAGNSAGQAATF